MSASALGQFVGSLRQKSMLLGALLVFSTLLLYCRVAHYEFLDFDDSQYVRSEQLHSVIRFGFASSPRRLRNCM